MTQASILARQGSGSACRSLWGGFVGWKMGEKEDGSDSHGYPIAGPDHWDVAMVIGVVSDKKKAIGSTEAMKNTAATSPLYSAFVRQADQDVINAKRAIMNRDLQPLGEIMEASTFKMHATMHTAVPPILYWHPDTVACINAIIDLRVKGTGAWVTMDAGPNIKVLCQRSDATTVQKTLLQHVQQSHILRPGSAPRVTSHD